jgi:hypothetical protein
LPRIPECSQNSVRRAGGVLGRYDAPFWFSGTSFVGKGYVEKLLQWLLILVSDFAATATGSF